MRNINKMIVIDFVIQILPDTKLMIRSLPIFTQPLSYNK